MVAALFAKNSLRQNALHFPKYRSTLLEQGETPALLEKLKRFSPLLTIAMGPPHTRGLMCLYHELASISQAFSEDTKVALRVQPLCPCEIRICLMMTAHLNHMR